MCKAIEEMIKAAYERGCEERSIECAKDLLGMEKMPPEKVAKLTHLPLEKVLTLCERSAVAL